MNSSLKSALLSNKTLKVIAIIIGYGIWSLLAGIYTQSVWVDVPVRFYNVSDQAPISAQPETMKINFIGKRADLKYCKDIALNLDAAQFNPGQHCIAPTQAQLFLPKGIKLVHSIPSSLIINASGQPGITESGQTAF